MLRSMPEPRHDHLIGPVFERSTVAPVGVELGWVGKTKPMEPGPPLIVWNHRWEHDKRPDVLAAAIGRLLDDGAEFRLAVLGEAPTGVPAELAGLPALLGERLVHFGFAERTTYERILGSADVVVSTADHEFFGVAVVEAMAAGARPVLPKRLSYPELVPAEHAGESLWNTWDELHALLLASCDAGRGSLPAVMDHVRRFDWPHVAPLYDRLLDEATPLRAV
jgi:glycosyltransferase involved in cell wall biosynthesis